MNVLLLSPEKTLFSGEALMVEVPGEKGRFQMLDHHAPIVSILCKGNVRVLLPDNTENFFEITSGVAELNQNKITILVEQ